MDKDTLKNFGDKPDWTKKIVLVLCCVVFISSGFYVIQKVDFTTLFNPRKEKVMDKYQSNLNFATTPIGDSTAKKYTFKGVDCWLEYSIYIFKNEQDAEEAFGHRDLLGRGFLEGRQHNVLDWTNSSRVDYYFMKYDDYLSKTNMVRRIVLIYEKEIYDIETSCIEDIQKLAYELVNN